MALGIAHLISHAQQEGGSRTFNVTLGGVGNKNAIIIYVVSHYSVHTNCSATIGGVAATKFLAGTIGNNNACHAILGRINLSPGTYSVYISPNEFHVWQPHVYAVYDTLGWNGSITAYINQANNTTKTVTPTLVSGGLYVEHTNCVATTTALRPTSASSQILLQNVYWSSSGGYRHGSYRYKANVGTNPSISLQYTNNVAANYNIYAGIEYLPLPVGGGSVIWWFRKWMEEKKKERLLLPFPI